MANDKRQRKYPNLKRGGAIRQKYKQEQHPASAKNLRRGAGPGRPKGVPNKATREAKELARSILEDPTVQGKLLDQAQRGKLAPAVMTMLFHYAYGKPKDDSPESAPREFPRLVIVVQPEPGKPPPPPRILTPVPVERNLNSGRLCGHGNSNQRIHKRGE